MHYKKLISGIVIIILLSSGLFTMLALVPTASASPASQNTNSVYLNATYSGYENVGTSNSGSLLFNALENSTNNLQSFSFGIGTSESGTYNFGQIYYWSGTTVFINMQTTSASVVQQSISGNPPAYTYTTDWYYGAQDVSLTLTIGSWSQTVSSGSSTGSNSAQSGTVSGTNPTESYPVYYDYFAHFFTPTIGTGAYSASLKVTVSTAVLSGYTTTYQGGSAHTIAITTADNMIDSSSVSQTTNPTFTGWHYSSQTATWTNPTGTQAFQTSLSSSYASATTGTYNSNLPTSMVINPIGDPPVTSFTANWAVTNTVERETSTSTNTLSQSINEVNGAVNEWASSFSQALSPPSSWLNGQSLDGGTWNTVITWSVAHLLSVGAGTSPPYDVLYYSGSSSGSITNPSLYSSISQTNAQSDNSGYTVSYSTAEIINYVPNPISNLAVAFYSGSSAQLTYTTSEVIPGESEYAIISWGDGNINNYSLTQGNQQQLHTYSSLGQFKIQITLYNAPNPASYDGVSVPEYSVKSTVVYTISLNPLLSPIDQTTLTAGQGIYFNYTQSNLQVNAVSISLTSGTAIAQQDGTDSYVAYPSTAGSSGFTATWTATAGSVVVSYSVAYASPVVPSEYSPYLTVTTSNNATHSYPITLSGVPSACSYLT